MCVQRIKQMIENNKLSHAYLFHGAAGSPKQEAARYFVHSLFCEQKVIGGCQVCVACRQIISHNHPSLLWVASEENSFKIEQTREIQRAMNYLSVAGEYRVAVLEAAEKLTTEAANSLLKFLEEPEDNLIIILLIEDLEKVLPTIKSRCQKLFFDLPGVADVQVELIAKGLEAIVAERMASVWQDLTLILSIHERNKFAIMYNLVVLLSDDLINNRYRFVMALNQQWFVKIEDEKPTQREHEALVEFMIEWFYEWLIRSLGCSTASKLIDEQQWLKLQGRLASKKLQFVIEELMQLRANMSKKYNTQLMIEATLLKIQGE